MHDPAEMPQRLAAFLAEAEPEADRIEVTEYEVMTGGYSRLLARAVVEWHHGDDRRTEVLVLRGDPPADRSLIHTDRTLEWEVLRAVRDRGVRTPEAKFFDPSGDRLGTKAIVLEYATSHSFLPYAAAGGELEGLSERLADALASYHTIPLHELPAVLERPASWDAYISRRIDEWRRTADEHVEDLPILRFVAEWLDSHRPAPVPLTLIHGDFQSANLLVTPDGHFEILDWELASIGDPREDMGYFKAVAQAAPPDLLDEVGCELFCARYRELTGLSELQVNPAVVAYFLVLGVVGTVRRLLEGGAAYARGENSLLASLFNLNSIMFGASKWLEAADALGPAMDALAAAAAMQEA